VWDGGPTRTMASSFLRFLDHTQRRTTVGRTTLAERSARRRDLYLTRHNTHNRQTMSPVGFECTIPESERLQTHALRCPYTYDSGSRVRLGSGSNESYLSVCGVSRAGLGRFWLGSSGPSVGLGSPPACYWLVRV
jgi:hypothetical protein